MRPLRLVVLVVGVAATLMGLLWIGQGLGVIRWPASSFMIDHRSWSLRGALLAAFGIFAVLRAGRGPRR